MQLIFVLGLLWSGPALAQGVGPVTSSSASRPTQLEHLVADLDSPLQGNRSYAIRELRTQVRHTRRVLARRAADDPRHMEARVHLEDQRRQIGPAAAACLRNRPKQLPECAALLGDLGDTKWIRYLEDARRTAEKRGKKQIDRALSRLGAEGP